MKIHLQRAIGHCQDDLVLYSTCTVSTQNSPPSSVSNEHHNLYTKNTHPSPIPPSLNIASHNKVHMSTPMIHLTPSQPASADPAVNAADWPNPTTVQQAQVGGVCCVSDWESKSLCDFVGGGWWYLVCVCVCVHSWGSWRGNGVCGCCVLGWGWGRVRGWVRVGEQTSEW